MAKVPSAGELKHTLEVIHRVEASKDPHGQPVYRDSVVASDLLAAIEQLTGRDIEYARQLYHLASYRIRLRSNPKVYVNAFLRVKATGKLFGVGSVIDLDERGIWSEVLCNEVDPDEIGLDIEVSYLLLEDGSFLLLEDGSKILLEG